MFVLFSLGLLSTISGFVLNSPFSKRAITVGDGSCFGKPDGIYPLTDVFKYFTCKDGVSTYLNCPDNTIFLPGKNLCVSISTQSQSNFCESRWNDDFVNPWNCHKFLKCFQGLTYEFNCQSSDLVFNPYTDQCVYDYQYSCHQVSLDGYEKKQALKANENPCASRGDGNFSISDLFAYLQCDAQKATYVNCPPNELFDPVNRKCADGALFNVKNICIGEFDGQYRNPWNCHGFISCVYEVPYLFPCQEKDLVYDPYGNKCESSSKFTCKELPTVDNPCNGKADGNYSLPDIFTYLSCKSGVGVTNSCPQRTIFDPSLEYCMDISNVTTTKFCLQREDGDYMNPWNCQRYLQCTNGLTRDYPCLINNFIFNPQLDVCVRLGRYPCNQILTTTKLDAKENPCANKSDGKYLISDVFAYLQCTAHQESYVNCSENQIFDPIKSACTESDRYNMSNFCSGKIDGQYRNPWNCHSFISCVHENLYELPCPSSLVFNPYTNQCENALNFTCHQLETDTGLKIGDICSDLPDGNYATRNVFQILQCKSHRSNAVDCPADQIYIPGDVSCTNAAQVNLDNFCEKRSEGNWQNPWDCQSFLTCRSKHKIFNQNCSLIVALHYNPITDACEYPNETPCVQLSAFPKNEIFFDDVSK